MKGCKERTPRMCSNPSLSKPTKATNDMEELERKNQGRSQDLGIGGEASKKYPTSERATGDDFLLHNLPVNLVGSANMS
jgi:hypothetical protein